MENSYYKIVGNKNGRCKIFFTDRRTDKFRHEIQEIFSKTNVVDGIYVPISNDFTNGRYERISKQIENVKRKIDDCLHKVMAARFNLALIEEEVSNSPSIADMKNYSQMISNSICDQAELKNDILIYETESFLFQIRTNIDIIIQLLKYIPDYNYLQGPDKNNDRESFVFDNRIKEKNTTYKMREGGHTELSKLFDCNVDDWISELTEMRNEIAHRSSLKGFTSFIFDSGKEKVIYPQMPNGIKVDEYCREIFKKLLFLYNKIFDDFILPKLNF